MTPYIVCFSMTIFLSYLDEIAIRKKSLTHYMFAFLVTIIPAILAGCRDNNIGTDVMVYAYYCFQEASRYGSDVLSVDFNPAVEIGFYFFAWVSSMLFDTVNGLLFFVSWFINIFVYCTFYRSRRYCSICLGELVFLLLFYNEAYNAMRQYMAMSVILFGMTYLLEHRYFHAIFWAIFAYMFHHSSVIGWVIMALLAFCNNSRCDNLYGIVKKNTELQWKKIFFVLVLMVLCGAFFEYIASLLLSLGVFGGDKYFSYIADIGRYGDVGYSINMMIAYIGIFMAIIFNRKYIWFIQGAIILFIGDMAMYYLRFKLIWLMRISMWFFFMRLLYVSQMPFSFKEILGKKMKYSYLGTVVTIGLCILYWYVAYIKSNLNETYPYTSAILGI